MIKKEKGLYRLIIIVVKINRITIRNTNIPFNVNYFSNEFSNLIIVFLIDFLLGYNQLILNLKFRDIIVI